MQLEISFDSAKTRFPDLVAEILDKLRSSSSKEKSSRPEDLVWYINWCQEIKSYTFGEFLERVQSSPLEPEIPDLTEEGVRSHLGNSIIWSIKGKIRRWTGTSQPFRTQVPNEINRYYLSEFVADAEKKRQLDAMTEEEKLRYRDDLLRQLGKSRGFSAFLIPGGPK